MENASTENGTGQSDIFFIPPNEKELKSPYEYFESLKIETAQPFTVSLKTVVVAEDYDDELFRGKNDILVTTKSSLGTQPLVERIHFYEDNIEAGTPINNIIADTMFVTDDYNGKEHLQFEVNVVEVDTDIGERKEVFEAFQSLAGTAGAVFPAILPYAFAAGAFAGVIKKVIDSLEKNTDVIKRRFRLYPASKTHLGVDPLLQWGTYVVFKKPVNPSGYKYSDGCLIAPGNSKMSYVLLYVSPEEEVSPDFVINQKIATLLTQMKESAKNPVRDTVACLTDTLTKYHNFKNLNRYLELNGRSTLTDAERTLKERIEKDPAIEPILYRCGLVGSNA